MTLKIRSYVGIDNLRFDQSTKDEAINHYGLPISERTSQLGNIEYEYTDFILRFNPHTSKFIECTLLPYAKATINDIAITWDKPFLKKMCQLDGESKDAYGFIVLRKFGLAITGIHDNDASQLAITVFRQNKLEEFLEDSSDFDVTTF